MCFIFVITVISRKCDKEDRLSLYSWGKNFVKQELGGNIEFFLPAHGNFVPSRLLFHICRIGHYNCLTDKFLSWFWVTICPEV